MGGFRETAPLFEAGGLLGRSAGREELENHEEPDRDDTTNTPSHAAEVGLRLHTTSL